MHIYLVETSDYGYDEYNAFVIRAKSRQEALTIAQQKTERINFTLAHNFGEEKVTITLITAEGKPGIILGSYNAG